MTHRSWLAKAGSHPTGVWLIKHVISPIDGLVVRVSRGRLAPPSRLLLPSLLLTVAGRRSGELRTVPLVFMHSGDGYIVANARPAGERSNPWVLNLRAAGEGTVRVGGHAVRVSARELSGLELERAWPDLVAVWPAFAEHFAATGERSVFELRPVEGGS